jgi:hypothetical protein
MTLFDIVPTGLDGIDLPAGYKHIIPTGLSMLIIRVATNIPSIPGPGYFPTRLSGQIIMISAVVNIHLINRSWFLPDRSGFTLYRQTRYHVPLWTKYL